MTLYKSLGRKEVVVEDFFCDSRQVSAKPEESRHRLSPLTEQASLDQFSNSSSYWRKADAVQLSNRFPALAASAIAPA